MCSSPTPSVLILDDRALIAEALAQALQSAGLPTSRGLVHGPTDVLYEVARHSPGVILLDLDLRRPGGQRVDTIDLVRRLSTAARVVVLSEADDVAPVGLALMAGAHAAVPKQAPLAALVDVLRSALNRVPDGAHHLFLVGGSDHPRPEGGASARLQRLTPRERAVLERLAQGRRPREIADELVLALTTVRSHIRSVLVTLDASSQVEAVALLERHRAS